MHKKHNFEDLWNWLMKLMKSWQKKENKRRICKKNWKGYRFCYFRGKAEKFNILKSQQTPKFVIRKIFRDFDFCFSKSTFFVSNLA